MKTPVRILVASAWFCAALSGLAGDPRIGLISYWPLDVDNAGTTPDMGPLNNTLTDFNGPGIVPGQFGNAFSFSGSQYASLTHDFDNSATGLPIYNSPKGYTIAMWVKGAAQTAKYLFTEGCTTNTNPLFIIQTGNAASTNSHLDIIIRGIGFTPMNHTVSTSVVFDNNWHHIAWVDNLGSAKLYVDGNLDGTPFNYPYPGSSAIAFNTTTIGALVRSTVSGYFNGLIDDVAIWERPLSQDEVNQVRTNSLTIPASPLIVAQPVGSTNTLGSRLSLAVSAVGTPPLFFQWLENGTPLSGASSRRLVLTNLDASGSNSFSVIVSNATSWVTSDAAPVVVLPDPTPAAQNGLVSYWPLDTVIDVPPGTNSPDIYYNHTDIWLTNMTSGALVPGVFSNGLSFANNQYGARLGGTPIYGSTNYTVSFWVNAAPGQGNKMVFAEGGTNATGGNGDYFLLGTENPAGGGALNVKSSGTPSLIDVKSKQTVFDGT